MRRLLLLILALSGGPALTAACGTNDDPGVPTARPGSAPPASASAPATVVLAPGAIRVSAHTARPGTPADGPMLSWTGTTRVVRVTLDVGLQNLARPAVVPG